MEKIKVKEIKEDAIINIPVNKNFYMMVKESLYNMFSIIQEKGDSEACLTNITTKPYNELSNNEKCFFTYTLLMSEIEKQAQDNNLYVEKEINVESLLNSMNKEDATD
jgi:hypothetical protein